MLPKSTKDGDLKPMEDSETVDGQYSTQQLRDLTQAVCDNNQCCQGIVRFLIDKHNWEVVPLLEWLRKQDRTGIRLYWLVKSQFKGNQEDFSQWLVDQVNPQTLSKKAGNN
jgi:hypothetical protein